MPVTLWGRRYATAAAAAPILSYLTSSTAGDGSSQEATHTFSAVSFGTFSATRRIVVASWARNSSGAPVMTTASIGDDASPLITNIQTDGSGNCIAFLVGAPTGTSGNVVINYTSFDATRVGLAAWSLTGASSATPAASVNTAATDATTGGNLSLAIPSSGVAIGYIFIQGNGSDITVTETNLTERFDTPWGIGSGFSHAGADTSTGGTQTVGFTSSVSISGAGGQSLAIASAWS